MRAVRIAARWIGLTLVVVIPLLLAAGLLRTGLRAGSAVAAPGPADPTDALVALAATACVLVLAWLAAIVLIAATITTLDARGRGCSTSRRMLSALTPATVQRMVAALVGAGVVTGLASPAWASDVVPPAPPSHVTASADLELDRDRQGSVSAESGSAPSTPREVELDPGWVPLPPTGSERATGAPSTTTPEASSPTLLTTGPRAGSQPLTEVVVRRGDTLWDLAARHLGDDATDAEIATEWPRWYAQNRALVGSDPDHILPGQRLSPPVPANL